jgi:hypothetical protein
MKARVLVSFTLLLGAGMTIPLTAQEKATIDRLTGPARLSIQGDAGRTYRLESAADLLGGSWAPLLTFSLTNGSQTWFDVDSLIAPVRFYRLSRHQSAPAPVHAGNFLLVDHTGVARELHYHQDAKAIVLIFMEGGSARFLGDWPAIQAVRDQFAPQGVQFWLVHSGTQTDRDAIATQVGSLGIDLPVLHDRDQAIARSFGAGHSSEAVCVNPATWTIFYRGAVNDRTGNPPLPVHHHYLADALADFVANRPRLLLEAASRGESLPVSPIPPPSYATDVAPLLLDRCVHCHSPGNIAPWSMTSHSVVQAHAASIRQEVLSRRMPPWHADPHHGVFANDTSLNAVQLNMLVRWIQDGAPRGGGNDPLADHFASTPPPTDYPNAWPAVLGAPDVVITLPTFNIPATGEVDYQYPSVVLNLPADVWLRAAVVKPGNLRVVHHVLVFVGSYFEAFLNDGLGLSGFFAGYVPGAAATTYPADTGKFLARNATLTFQLHYTTTGQAESDQTQLGLYFHTSPPSRQLFTRAASTTSITIPPGAPDHQVTNSVVPSASQPILLHEMAPHMHYRGKRFRYEAVYPGGATEVLLSVPKYDFEWQTVYRLAQPKLLPAGTAIRCVGAFDNSALNRDNPDSTVTVSFGEQTHEEMFIGYFNYTLAP